MLIEAGIRGKAQLLDEDLSVRLAEVVVEIAAMQDSKIQLKELKLENRKLRQENTRLNKLLEE